jgi:hypothetical protein
MSRPKSTDLLAAVRADATLQPYAEDLARTALNSMRESALREGEFSGAWYDMD